MYADPKRVRRPYARLRLDDYETKLLDALVAYTGLSPAELVRQLVMAEAVEVCGVNIHVDNVSDSARYIAGRTRHL